MMQYPQKPISKKRRAALLAVGLCSSLSGFAAHSADVFKGREVYSNYCEGCHGIRGEGVMPGTPDFTRRQNLLKPNPVLFESIRSGNNAMPSFRGILKDQEILDVIAHLRTLPGRP